MMAFLFLSDNFVQQAVWDRHLLISLASGSVLGLLLRDATFLAATNNSEPFDERLGMGGRVRSDHSPC